MTGNGAVLDGRAPADARQRLEGILKDMYDTLSMNLEKATETESAQQKHFESNISVQDKEMLTLKTTKTKKDIEKANAEKVLADTEQDLDDKKGGPTPPSRCSTTPRWPAPPSPTSGRSVGAREPRNSRESRRRSRPFPAMTPRPFSACPLSRARTHSSSCRLTAMLDTFTKENEQVFSYFMLKPKPAKGRMGRVLSKMKPKQWFSHSMLLVRGQG